MLANVQRKRFTAAEYHCMAEAGILRKQDHLELIKGDIIYMAAAIGSQHAACVNRLNRLFTRLLSDMAIIGVQNPVSIGEHSEPEPDIALLKPRPDFYAQSHPEPEDVLLIAEVSDTSLGYDRETKLPLYAKSGIKEAWIVNLKEECVEVYTNLSEQGYDTLKKFRKGMTVTPSCFPDVEIPVDEIIGQWKYPLAV